MNRKEKLVTQPSVWGRRPAWYVEQADLWIESGWTKVHIVESGEQVASTRGGDPIYRKFVVRDRDFDRCFPEARKTVQAANDNDEDADDRGGADNDNEEAEGAPTRRFGLF